MAGLGELERDIMDALWASPDGATASSLLLTLAESGNGHKSRALTTVLTVLSRLEAKGFVEAERSSRPRIYRATGTLADHTATLMAELLDGTADREAALARFVGSVSPSEADTLRRLLR